jgi:S-adenosylmethionine hydrolase
LKPRRGEKKTNRRVSVSSLPELPASPRPRVPIITLLTDFGSADYFVGAVKGVILSIAPQARIVDLTHQTPPQDIEAAAFTLLAAYKSFPKGTVHVAVVDPGVGSSRRGIVVSAAEQIFVGPDNGIFSYIYERETKLKVYDLSNAKFFRQPVSPTFHGRDIFAPVAAALTNGVRLASLGKPVNDPVRLASLTPERRGSRLLARIIHIDRFGNCVTNLTADLLTPEMIEAGAVLISKRKTIRSFRKFYEEETAAPEKVFCIWGSAGFLEIAAMNTSAAKLLGAERGGRVIVRRS